MDYLKLDRYYFDVAYKMKQWRRIQFLGMIVEYAFSGEEPECKSGELFALFNLVKPDIDRLMAAAKKSGQKNDKKDVVSDEKTNEKPVKNTENSSKTIENTAGKDIVSAEIGKQENSPIPPKRINNNINNNNISFCGVTPQIKRDVFLNFTKKNFANPEEETDRFFSYYETRSWTLTNGRKVEAEKIAELSNLWEPKDKENGILKMIHRTATGDQLIEELIDLWPKDKIRWLQNIDYIPEESALQLPNIEIVNWFESNTETTNKIRQKVRKSLSLKKLYYVCPL